MKGTVTFSVIGAYCEEYINDIFEQGISISNIRNTENIIYADIDMKYYPIAAKLSRKYGVRVRIVNKKGMYFRLSGIKKRPGLVLGIMVSAAMVFTLRLFIWHIDVHGNNTLTDEQVLSMIENYGFTAGVFANSTDALDAERKIMLSSDRIKWINIEVNGSRADVYLSERDIGNDADIDYKTPCNIVASRSCVITDTDVTSGKLMYEKGSGVAEGSVIVSGFVSSGEALILVHSDAEIIGEFTETPEFSMNYTTVEKVPSDNTFTHRQLMILGIVLPLDNNAEHTENTVCTETTEQCTLFGVEMPFRLRTETYRGYIETTVTRSPDDIRRNLDRQLEQYTNNFLKQYEILDTEKNYEETSEGIILKTKITLKGNIGVKKPIYEH